jgi:P-type Ca2+ transporter type 2C
MILWINLVTNGLPALALGVDPPDPTQMREPPRKRTGSLLGTRDWLGIAFVGVCMGAAAIPIALVGAILMSASIHLVAVLVPSLRPVFQTFPLSLDEWLILLALSASILPAVEIFKLVQRLLAGSKTVEGILGPTSRRAG